MICGRCGHKTAENSTYCPTCRWTLFVDAPEGTGHALGLSPEIPKSGGLLARRKQEGLKTRLEKELHALLDPRIEALEEQLNGDNQNFEMQRALGLATWLDGKSQRANAHFQRAYEINPDDLETVVNYAIVLAQRGQILPSLEVLQKARQKWTDLPLLTFNFALVALQARRANDVLAAIDVLEKQWYDSEEVAQDYHDEAQTLRGLAFLLQNKSSEAKAAFEAAASHTVTLQRTGPTATTTEAVPASATVNAPIDLDDPDLIQIVSRPDGDEAEDEVRLLEGKFANADLLNNIALADAAQGRADVAISRLNAALRIDPSHTRVLNNLGVLAYEQGELELAFKYLDSARQIEEGIEQPDPVTSNHLGVVLSAMGRLDEGMTRFQRAGSHERAEFEVYYNLGRAYIEHGKPEAGVEYLRHAFQLNPNAPDVHVVLGAAYLLRGKPELMPEALRHLKRALQINSQHRIAFADLALALLESKNFEGAVKVITQALRVHPRSPETLFILGELVMDRGDESHWIQASTQFGTALEVRPDLVAALYNAALCQYLLGFRDTAAQQLQIVTDRDPSFGPAYFLLGVGHATAKRFNEALTAWHTGLKYEPGNVDLHCNIGYIHYIKGRWEEAITHFMAAHRLEPMNPDVLSAAGLCFARASRFDSAIESFRRSLEIKPRAPITHSNLGLAYYLHGEVEKAIEHWRIVAQLDSGYARRKEEEGQRSFDDSLVAMRPINWRERVIKLAPTLPRPHTRLIPGFNAHHFRPVISDAKLQHAFDLKRQLDEASRLLAWMNSKS